MKQLKQIVKESLFGNIGIGPEAQIEDWIKENIEYSEKLEITSKGDKYIIKAKEVIFRHDTNEITNGLFEWADGIDYMQLGTQIISLEGCPKVMGEINIVNCDKLTSLKGCPKICRKLDCRLCHNLNSLKYAPLICDEICCGRCDKLTSLKGCTPSLKKLNCENCKNLKDISGVKCKMIICNHNDKLNLTKEEIKNLTGANSIYN